MNYNHGYEYQMNSDNNNPVSYRFNNGIPNQLTLRAWPFDERTDVDHDLGCLRRTAGRSLASPWVSAFGTTISGTASGNSAWGQRR